jgi:hypothetical protein
MGATPPYQSQVNKRLAKPKEDNAKNVYQVTVNDEFNKSCMDWTAKGVHKSTEKKAKLNGKKESSYGKKR